jgi:hypothetical protein
MMEPIDSALEKSFVEVVEMIQSAKQTVMQTVNAQLVELYWQVGAYQKAAVKPRAFRPGI